jgi:hypothetical protein
MNRIRVIGVALVAVFAMSVGASAAIGHPSAFKTGTFPVTFTGKGGVAKFESAGGSKIECKESKSKGEVKGELEASVTIEYKGSCAISGILKGTCVEPIKTSELLAQPGDELSAAGTELPAGQKFTSKAKAGGLIAEPECAGTKIKVEGNLVCENPEPNKLQTTGKVVCAQVKAGEQKFTAIKIGTKARETKLELVATAIFLKEKDAQTTTEELTFTAPVEQTS